jgi:hypothetical protein
MPKKKKSVKRVLTEVQVRKLIAKERKIWQSERDAELLKHSLGSDQLQTAKAYGRCLIEMDRNHAHRQSQCNHRKGGLISRRTITDAGGEKTHTTYTMPNKGTSPLYAVIKHQFSHGDIWVRCLRCGKWWKPPLRSQYKTDRDFWRAMFEYEEALNFDTNNTTSGGVLLRFNTFSRDGKWVDGTEIVRENLANAAGY